MTMLQNVFRLSLISIVLLSIFQLLAGTYVSFFFAIPSYDEIVLPADFEKIEESAGSRPNNYFERSRVVLPNLFTSGNNNESEFDDSSLTQYSRHMAEKHERMRKRRALNKRRKIRLEIENIIANTSSFRFPTVAERVKYMMGDWYSRSITIDYAKTHICPFLPKYERQVDWDFLISRNEMNYLVDTNYTPFTLLEKNYFIKEFLSEAHKIIKGVIAPSSTQDFGMVMRIGDNFQSYRCIANDIEYPLIKKGRYVRLAAKNKHTLDKEVVERSDTRKGIIWPMEIERHLMEPLTTYKQHDEIPWHLKKPIAFWRGTCSGFYHGLRWTAVEMWYNTSSYTNISYSHCHLTRERHQRYVTKAVGMQEQLHYKYLVSIEGNDIASNLKWSLASNSLVFMPLPTVASAAGLEEFLVPFIHFVPVKDDFSDLVEMVLWAMDNDAKCKWISEQATQFINDLWDSETAQEDMENLRIELGERYYNQFGRALYSCIDGAKDYNSTNALKID